MHLKMHALKVACECTCMGALVRAAAHGGILGEKGSRAGLPAVVRAVPGAVRGRGPAAGRVRS
jgi:hypothetical protein